MCGHAGADTGNKGQSQPPQPDIPPQQGDDATQGPIGGPPPPQQPPVNDTDTGDAPLPGPSAPAVGQPVLGAGQLPSLSVTLS